MKKLLAAMFVALLMVGLLASSLAQAEEHEWTNKQGKTIKAEFVSAGEETVTISMGGKSYVVKLADLSPQSRALAAKLRVQKSKAREPQNDKTPPAKSPEVGGIDLDDLETLDKIIAEAIDGDTLQKRGEKGEVLLYAPNDQTPYTGWAKKIQVPEGQIRMLGQVKGGKADGLVTSWYSKGQKSSEVNFKDGKQDGLETDWYRNGQKRREVNYKDGERDGLTTWWYKNEQEQKASEETYKDGKTWSAVAWKPNGEKCPHTNVVDGNGVMIWYNDDGTEGDRLTFKDGERVKLIGEKPYAPAVEGKPLRIAYSDWPGWVAWEIGIQKGFFKDAGVNVEFTWLDYVPSMDSFVAGKVDAVCMTNGDALITGATGKKGIAILINDYSNGNDMVVARQGIDSVAALKGKKIGVEVGFLAHLLLLKALERAGLAETDVTLVNVPTDKTAKALALGKVDAISAWQPNSGQALELVGGSKAIFTSADLPGIIYDLLYVSPESLAARRDDWEKLVKVWFQIVDFINDPANKKEVLEILSARVQIKPDEYEPFLKGTRILTLAENRECFKDATGFDSVVGSSRIVNDFNVAQGIYKAKEKVEDYLDSSFVDSIILK